MRLSRQRRTSPAALQSCTIHTGTLVSIWLPGSAVVSWSSAALEPGLLTHGRLWGRLELSVQWDTGNSHQAAMLPTNRPMFSELASPVAGRRTPRIGSGAFGGSPSIFFRRGGRHRHVHGAPSIAHSLSRSMGPAALRTTETKAP